MASGPHDIDTNRNVPFYLHLEYEDKDKQPVNFDGFAVVQIRRQNNSTSPLIAEFTTDDYITVTDNEIDIYVPASIMVSLPCGDFYYELLADVGGEPDGIVAGHFNIHTGVVDE